LVGILISYSRNCEAFSDYWLLKESDSLVEYRTLDIISKNQKTFSPPPPKKKGGNNNLAKIYRNRKTSKDCNKKGDTFRMHF